MTTTPEAPVRAPRPHRDDVPPTADGPRAGGYRPAPRRRPSPSDRLTAVTRGAVLLLTGLLTFMIIRLPWIGDMGVHAATLERLRHDLLHPGNPMVDSPTESPYHSPWMVILAVFAKATDLGTFDVLRCAAIVGLVLLFTGVRHFTRTLSAHPAAPSLAILCLLFLWGTETYVWSGFLGLVPLSLNIAYPSTFTLGLGLHFLALLTAALRRGTASGWWTYTGLGLLWALLLLCHQFSGIILTFGALGVLVAARPWPARATWLRLGAGLAAGTLLLALWPYYSFFSLFGADGLEQIHITLYHRKLVRFTFVPLGVLALAVRFRRDRRDPLVVWFLLGLATVVAGAVLDKWSLGRAEPAVVMPAQIAAALAAVEGGRRLLRAAYATVLAGALALGAWAQNDALGFVLRDEALPKAVTAEGWTVRPTYEWTTEYARYGEVFMTDWKTAQKLPGYGFYTVVAGYPDFFLPDEERRLADTERYFAAGTPREERIAILRRYRVTWILTGRGDHGLSGRDPALRKVATGPSGQLLYRFVG
ncbi:hypothetical protein ACWDX6_27990 [Streptomyces sp. NPDC003027]